MFNNDKSNRNLFNVDFEAIKATLVNANSLLVEQSNTLINSYELLPLLIDSPEDLASYKKYLKESDEFSKISKNNRLANGKSFREATKVINDFYKDIDEPIAREVRVVKEKINKKAREEFKRQQEEILYTSENNLEREQTLISNSDGEIIVETSDNHKAESNMIISIEDTKMKLNYIVKDYKIEKLDFNKLSRYFTDAAIMTACKKHLEAEGNTLEGVEYDSIVID
tara:strand:+ start:5482 stop:6159 length:678 start_codon:yes stop_codon:yes gene_type:complete